MSYIPPYEGQQLACTVLRIERSSIHDGAGFRTGKYVFNLFCGHVNEWVSLVYYKHDPVVGYIGTIEL